MSKEDLHQDEEDTSKLHDTGSESEDEDDDAEFEELLSKFEGSDEDEPVSREEFNALKKGVAKYFSEKGRKQAEESKKATTETKSTPEAKANEVDDLTEMFLEQNPKVELVKEKLDKVAKALYGGSLIKAWRNEPWLREMADSIEQEKSEEEANKAKVGAPSKTIGSNKVDFKKMSPKEAMSLSDDDFAKWSEANQ